MCGFVPLPYFCSDQWLIGRLIEAKSTALVCNKFLLNIFKFNFLCEKKISLHSSNFLKIKPVLTPEQVSMARVAAFSVIVSRLLPAGHCRRQGNALCLCLPVWSAYGALSQAFPLVLQSPASIAFWNSLLGWWPDYQQGLTLRIKLELCCSAAWPTRYSFYLLHNAWWNCVKFQLFSSLLKMLKLRQAKEEFQCPSPRLDVQCHSGSQAKVKYLDLLIKG